MVGFSVAVVGVAVSGIQPMTLFDNQFTAQHTHLALKAILSWLIRSELHRHFLTLWQQCILVEIGKEHSLRAS